VEKSFLSLHPQAPQQSVAYEKETSNRGAKIRNLFLSKIKIINQRRALNSTFSKNYFSNEKENKSLGRARPRKKDWVSGDIRDELSLPEAH